VSPSPPASDDAAKDSTPSDLTPIDPPPGFEILVAPATPPSPIATRENEVRPSPLTPKVKKTAKNRKKKKPSFTVLRSTTEEGVDDAGGEEGQDQDHQTPSPGDYPESQ